MDVGEEIKQSLFEPGEDLTEVVQEVFTLWRRDEFKDGKVEEIFKRNKSNNDNNNEFDKSSFPALFHTKILPPHLF